MPDVKGGNGVTKPKLLPGFFVTEKPIGITFKNPDSVAFVGPTEAKTKYCFTFRRVKGKERDMVVITS